MVLQYSFKCTICVKLKTPPFGAIHRPTHVKPELKLNKHLLPLCGTFGQKFPAYIHWNSKVVTDVHSSKKNWSKLITPSIDYKINNNSRAAHTQFVSTACVQQSKKIVLPPLQILKNSQNNCLEQKAPFPLPHFIFTRTWIILWLLLFVYTDTYCT